MRPLAATILTLLLMPPPEDGFLGVYLDSNRTEAVVVEVIPNSPAAAAGVRVGDVFLAIGDRATNDRQAFEAALGALGPGASVVLRLRRDGKEQQVTVTLGKRPTSSAPPPAPVGGDKAPQKRPAPQAEVAPVRPASSVRSPARPGYLGIGVHEAGDRVLIDRVIERGPASQANVRVGDVVTSCAGQPVRSLDDLDRALARVEAGSPLVLELSRNQGDRVRVELVAAVRPDEERSEKPAAPASTPRQPAPARPAPLPEAGSESLSRAEFEREIAALRAELAELRKQLLELRPNSGRE